MLQVAFNTYLLPAHCAAYKPYLIGRQSYGAALQAVCKACTRHWACHDCCVLQTQHPQCRQVAKEVHVAALQVNQHEVLASNLHWREDDYLQHSRMRVNNNSCGLAVVNPPHQGYEASI